MLFFYIYYALFLHLLCSFFTNSLYATNLVNSVQHRQIVESHSQHAAIYLKNYFDQIYNNLTFLNDKNRLSADTKDLGKTLDQFYSDCMSDWYEFDEEQDNPLIINCFKLPKDSLFLIAEDQYYEIIDENGNVIGIVIIWG